VGASDGPLAVDRVEGWSWTSPIPADYSGAPVRLTVDQVKALRPPPDCNAVPQLPTFDIVSSAETLPVTVADGYPAQVAVLTNPAADPSTATWTNAATVKLAGYSGPTRILAKRAGTSCPTAVFDATYDVRAAYTPRWNAVAGTAGGPSNALDKADAKFKGWITGHSEYTPGGNVNASFQTPTNAYGPIDSSLVVLGDRGSYTATFGSPITNGPGYDFAAFENGFASGANDFLEVAYLEVSSNGTDFVRFDSASRRATTVAAFGTQDPAELGGLPGKDLAGKGTPFDLSVLKNKPQVRSGAVDLDRITHVRLKDIQGDGNDKDSFGRPIYDPNPVTGSAGYDLTGIGVINQRDETAPVVTVTSAPSGSVATGDASIVFTVDDATATKEYRLDGGAWTAATSPIALTGLANGSHTVDIRATDAAGNVGTATATWTVAIPEPTSRARADFDGDGTTDVAVFRPSDGGWYVEGHDVVFLGLNGDIPVPGDYDGDGVAERAVFRPSTGAWFVEGATEATYLGLSGDLPVPGDYDGDGDTDVAVFRPSDGGWYRLGSPVTFHGLSSDLPVPEDFDGDGTTDVAVFRPSTGAWFIDGADTAYFGADGDVPLPGDFDGDGETELAVFRPSAGAWFVDGADTTYFGVDGDVPVPGSYDGDEALDIAVFRPSSGAWFVDGAVEPTYFGLDGDIPAPRNPAR
jgi:hypothetical protein